MGAMIVRSVGAAVITVLLSLSGGVAAEQTRTEQLVWECDENPSSPEAWVKLAHCAGYVSGMLDMHALMVAPQVGRAASQFCLPADGISNDQAIKVFLKWAREHPEELHKSARVSLLIALKDAFPCP
jgi:hypothetical protein